MLFPSRLAIPAEVLEIVRELEAAGFETWCVGGAVRDNLLGYDNKDFDLATAAPPKEVRKLFHRTVPVGIEHGTVAVLDQDDRPHEVTTFRRDVTTDGRHAVVEFGVSLDEDLARRDFTINAIAYHPLWREWRDPFDGRHDLDLAVVRAVGAPHDRFREDYLRILRALRFAGRFRFQIEAGTWSAAKSSVAGVQHLSAERVRDEWFKGLETARKPSELVALWGEVGAMEIWLPEIGEGEGWRRTFRAIDSLPRRDPVLITSWLADDPSAALRRLKCSNAQIERARRVGVFRGSLPDPGSLVEVRKWMARVGSAVDDLVAIAGAAGGSTGLQTAVEGVRGSGAPLSVADLAVGGDDLMELGVSQGVAVGDMLRRLLDDVLEHPELNTRDRLRERAQALAEGGPPPSSPGGEGAGEGDTLP